MLKCSKCKLEKPKSDFHICRSNKRGYHSWCKLCAIDNMKKYYGIHHSYKATTKQNAIDSREKLKAIVNTIKIKYKCYFCKESCPECLQFHHLNEMEKDWEVSQLTVAKSKERLFTEINKCLVVCANCHLKIHHNLIIVPENQSSCNELIDDYFIKIGTKYYFK